jgi:divalent metal cation (Fe/Co/Zn/Cd) transporter
LSRTQSDVAARRPPGRNGAIVQRARWLAYATVAWMTVEATVALWSGAAAGSVALLGFGGDSVIEVASGAVILWRFSSDASERRERRAAQLIAWSLMGLAALVAVDSISALIGRHAPQPTVVGVVLAAASLVLMPFLAAAKRRVASQAESQALAGDAQQSSVCAWLSAVTLLGLGLRAICGWWWADPMAALGLVPLIAWEGANVLRSKTLADTCCSS